MCTYIFAGRFQPFHNGHKQVFDKICEKMSSTDVLVLAVVSPYTSDSIKDESFVIASTEHHDADRNPWYVSVPLTAVSRIARLCPRSEQVITTLLPRPEYGWDIIEKWFPGDRVWIIPNAGEDFDEKKSSYFRSLGDRVERISDTTGVSGWNLRNLYKEGNYNEFKSFVPDGIAEIYFRGRDNSSAQNDFQKRAEKFESNSRWVTDDNINSVPVDFFAKKEYKVDNIVDLGGCTGYLSYSFYQNDILRNKIKNIVLVDKSNNMLAEAKKKLYPVSTRNCSIESFCDFTSIKYNAVLIRQVLHYVDNLDNVVRSLHNIINKDSVIYVGQIIVEDEECRQWHDALMRKISLNRKRSFTATSLADLFINNGFEIIHQESSEYEERVTDLVKRRVSPYMDSTIDHVLDELHQETTESVQNKMKIKFIEGDLLYTVKFLHLFLKESSNNSNNT